jgi:hypothetical protein
MSPDPPQVAFSFVMVDLRPELIPASEYYKNRLLSRQKPRSFHSSFHLPRSLNFSLYFFSPFSLDTWFLTWTFLPLGLAFIPLSHIKTFFYLGIVALTFHP